MTFPITPDGLVVDAVVNLEAAVLTLPSLLVMALPPGPTCDGLIGMDVLRRCKLIVDGPGDLFLLEF